MTEKLQIASLEQEVERFARCYEKFLGATMAAAVEAGKVLVDCLAVYPQFKEVLRDRCPAIPPHHINTLERVGRGSLLPEIAYGTSSAGRVALGRLSISDQHLLLKEGVSLVLLRDGTPEVLRVEIDNLTPNQVRQVFHQGGVRSEGAQRAWLEDQRTREKVVVVEKDFSVSKRGVLIGGKYLLTKSQLIQLLSQIPD